MSIEISRRDFLKLVSTTASAAALAGKVAFWPAEALSRPVAEPTFLALNDYSYIIDPYFDFCPELPTFREYLSLEGLTDEQMKEALKDHEWRFEYRVADPDDWSVSEIEKWLDSTVELDDLSPRESMGYSEYAPGIELHDHLRWEVAEDLGLIYIEGDAPGRDFIGVRFDGEIDDLNAGLARYGMNLVVRES